jgi:hypothetical protein
MKLTSSQVKNPEHTTLKSNRMQKLIEVFQRFVAQVEDGVIFRKDGHQNALFPMDIPRYFFQVLPDCEPINPFANSSAIIEWLKIQLGAPRSASNLRIYLIATGEEQKALPLHSSYQPFLA